MILSTLAEVDVEAYLLASGLDASELAAVRARIVQAEWRPTED